MNDETAPPDSGEAHVTRRELQQFRDFIDERFKALHSRMLLYMGVAVGLIRFDFPTPVTATALALVLGKAVLSIVTAARLH